MTLYAYTKRDTGAAATIWGPADNRGDRQLFEVFLRYHRRIRFWISFVLIRKFWFDQGKFQWAIQYCNHSQPHALPNLDIWVWRPWWKVRRG